MRVLFTFLLLVSIGSLWAARTDTVYLYNGDRITGEIKYLREPPRSFSTNRTQISPPPRANRAHISPLPPPRARASVRVEVRSGDVRPPRGGREAVGGVGGLHAA